MIGPRCLAVLSVLGAAYAAWHGNVAAVFAFAFALTASAGWRCEELLLDDFVEDFMGDLGDEVEP